MNKVENQNLKFSWNRTTNDTNGNPRYIVHFLDVADNYAAACFIANKVGGRKYHNKQYGGGIIFQSYNIEDTESNLIEAINNS